MSIARRLTPLVSTVLLIVAGAASAFAVNIDTGAQPQSAAWKGLAPYRWWLVLGVTVVAVLVQALADSLDSSADAIQEPSHRRSLVPRYALFSVVWLLGVAAVAMALGFRDAWKQPELYFVAVGTIAAVTFIEYIRSVRFKSVIMVAEFAYFGSPAAAEESTAFRARIMEELARAVKSRHGKGAFQVRKLRFCADASDSDDRRRALALARSSRCAVVIAGSVFQDGSEIGVTTAVLTPERLGRGRPDEAPGQRILLASPPEAVAEKKAATAAEAAAVAQLALGVAFFHRRRYLEAEDLLTSLRPQNYLALFYAAYAAFARRDYERASTLALQSAEIKPWQPALGIAAYSCFELGRNEEGRNLVSRLEEPDVERAIGPPWEEPVQLLPALAAFRLVSATLEEQVGDIIRLQEKRDLFAQHLPQYMKAVENYYNQDYEGALTALRPNMAEPAAQDIALFAVASLAAGRSDAQEWVKRAENTIMPTPTTNDEAACRWLMEAFARLGDVEGAARVLRVTLPLMRTETLAFDTQLLGIIHLSNMWNDPRIQQVLSDFGL